MKLHHKVNNPIQLLVIVVAIEIVLHAYTGYTALLVSIVVAIWILPTVRIRKKRARKPRTNTNGNKP